MATKRFDAADCECFLKLLPKTVEGRDIRHAVEVRHESFKVPDFVALLRAYGVAVVTAGDSDFPQIADATAPFVYARIMGTTEGEAAGYAPAALDTWVKRARTWARSEEHTSELQSLMRISYAVFCLKKKTKKRPT